jgi:crotonobetaine/carnitine-CoA ligase
MSMVSLADRAAEDGDRELIYWPDSGASTSRLDLHLAAMRWAGLLSEHGVQRGDRVMLALGNSIEFLGAHYGTQYLGAISVPVNTELRGESLRHPLALFEPRVIVADDDLSAVFESALDTVDATSAMIVVPANGMTRRLESLAPLAPVTVSATDACLIMSTSGTTGPSKGSVWDYGTVQQWARGYTRHLAYTDADRIYCCTPLFHANSLISGLATALHSGGAVVLGERFSVSNFWRTVVDGRATSMNLIGSMIDLLLRAESADGAELRKSGQLRTLLASSCSASSYIEVQRLWGVTPISAYGLTDFGTVAMTKFGELAPPGTVGRAVDEFEIKLVDESGAAVPTGVPGEVVIRPRIPSIAPQGYFRMPEATLESRRDLWFHTGDLLRMDGDGWLYFAGRVKDSMRRRGENVSAFEVESAAMTFPQLTEVAAYAVPSADSEDEIAVAIVLSGAVGEFDYVAFIEHVSAELPYFAVPRYVRIVEQLPKTPTQKVQKKPLEQDGVTPDTWDRVVSLGEVARNRRRR